MLTMTDAAEPNENTAVPTRRTGRGIVLILVMMMAYVEGPVLVGWLLNKLDAWPVAGKMFFIVFAPLEALYQRFEMVKRFYDWQNGL
jgi:MFS family permease